MIKVAILTVSDSTIAGIRKDLSGPALEQRCAELNWQVVAKSVVSDEEQEIAHKLRDWADSRVANVVLTTGGTGVAPRDVTPEATRSILHREVPGLAELMRSKGLEQTKFSVLSRAVAGTRNSTFILNLPGSVRGALHSFNIVEGVIPHIVDLLEGRTAH